jgi:tripartite-type tricarboxylate transporter receptor subunit TctC
VKLLLAVCASFSCAVSCALQAQNVPSGAVQLIVPFAAGGSSDVLARVVSSPLSEVWRQPVLVKNLPGHPSVSGAQVVASAEPDGRTFLVANASLAMNEARYRRLPYDALRSFTPISILVHQHLVFVVHSSSPIATITDLIGSARGAGAPVTYATAGAGTLAHLAGELLKLMTSTNFAHVPPKKAGTALDELMVKRVSCAILPLPRALPHVKSGQVRAIAVAGSGRASALPDVPTVGASVAGYGVSTWIGLLAPYGVSVPAVRQLSSDVQTVLRRPDMIELLVSLGYEPTLSTPDALQNRLRADIERYSRIVFDAGIRLP